MIQNLTLEGFKSFVFDDDIEFKDLTILTGLNSSGKSSIVQALLMLSQQVQTGNPLLEGHGQLEDLTNHFSKELNIEVELSNDETVSLNQKKSSGSFPKVIHIAADRFGPRSQLPIYMGENYNIGQNGENILKVIEYYSVVQPTLIPKELWFNHYDEEEQFAEALKGWLSVISPNVSFQQHLLSQTDSSYATFNEYRAKNVGFGLSYTLPVITSLLLGSITPNSIVIIENPEAHVHPRGQTEIARLIGRTVESGTQVLIETHSDHIINGIRIHAKKSDKNFHEKVAIHWLELNKKRNTERTAITLDKDGRSEEYPKGFFDQFEINARELL